MGSHEAACATGTITAAHTIAAEKRRTHRVIGARLKQARYVPLVQRVVRGRDAHEAVVRGVAFGNVLPRIETGGLTECLGYCDQVRELVLGVLEEGLRRAIRLAADFLF